MKERFVLSKGIISMHPMPRIPGQVPTREALAALKLAQQPAPAFHPAMLERQDGAYLTPTGVVKGLGLEKGQESSWIKFLETNLRADNEVVLRKAVTAKARDDKLHPVVRRAMLERALGAYRWMKKSLVMVTTPDELMKAGGVPKGGSYAKRVLSKDGKRYRYFYDEEKYKSWGGAHISGEEASHTAIRSGIQKAVDAGGTNGCDLKSLQPLVKRYGHKMVATVLDQDVKKDGKLKFAKGKLYPVTTGVK